MGLVSLPSEWNVVSKDETPERSLISNWALNVQQVLYARTKYVFTEIDRDTVLQIFYIWGSDEEGNERPLPEDMDISGKLPCDLIGARYGNVSELGEDLIETALDNLSVATFGVEISLTDEDVALFRYKSSSLYRGEKRVLVLLKYRAEFEDYWQNQFMYLLNTWVESLTFTPNPAPAKASTLSAALPALPSPPTLPKTTRLTSQQAPSRAEDSQPERLTPILPVPEKLYTNRSVFAVWLGLLAFTLFCTLCILVVYKHLRKKRKPPETVTVASLDFQSAETPPLTSDLITFFCSSNNPADPQDSPVPGERPNSSVFDVADGEGFERVYNILCQALSFIEASPAVPEKPLEDGDNPLVPEENDAPVTLNQTE